MRALVVDDTKLGRAIVSGILSRLGLEIQEAQNGREALQQLETAGPFDLATVDWNMPEMNGLEFVQAARGDEGNSGMKILMLTVEAEISNIIRAFEVGANEYAVKPVSQKVLCEKLRALGLEPACR